MMTYYITAECLKQTNDDQDADGIAGLLVRDHLDRRYRRELHL